MRKALYRGGLVIGVWLVASPWIFGFADVNLARWNSLFIGVAVFIASAWMELDET